jgi:hypothetical protein
LIRLIVFVFFVCAKHFHHIPFGFGIGDMRQAPALGERRIVKPGENAPFARVVGGERRGPVAEFFVEPREIERAAADVDGGRENGLGGQRLAEFAAKIGWYRRRSLRTSKMQYEFPSSVQDILDLTSDKRVFTKEAVDAQRKNIEAGTPYRLVTDNFTKKVEAQKTDASPFRIFRPPVYGHKYKLIVDPITASNEDTDFFAMSVFDDTKMEQVAVFCGREMSVEDYADYAVSIAKIYNNAIICPELNVAEGFIVSCRALGYYHFYYDSPAARKKREPGIRTTVSSKVAMIDKVQLMLNNNKITLHDEETVDELEWFEKKVRTSSGGAQSVKMAARKGKHDDFVACLWIYAGTLDERQLTGRTLNWSII